MTKHYLRIRNAEFEISKVERRCFFILYINSFWCVSRPTPLDLRDDG